MKSTIFFDQEAIFTDSQTIESIFKIKGIFLDKNTTVKLKGKITLAVNIYFKGACEIDDGSIIGTGSVLEDMSLGKNNNVREYSIIKATKFGNNNIIGPFCFLRDNTFVGNNCIVGNQVEIARSRISNEVKISHQAFIGDTTIGNKVIVGAGVIFCNHDSKGKQQSRVEEQVLLGSGSLIISPTIIGKNAIIAAGSVVTKQVEEGKLYLQKK